MYDRGYVEGMQLLVEGGLVTVDEILSAFSLMTHRGPRVSGQTWKNLVKRKGLSGVGTEWLGNERFRRVQPLVLAHFG